MGLAPAPAEPRGSSGLIARPRARARVSPTMAIIDLQTAKGAQRGSKLDPSGYDAGKKIKGRKRHILIDMLGLLLNVVVHASLSAFCPFGLAMATGPCARTELERGWVTCG